MPHLFVQDLTVIDCSILDNDRGLIGASWIVDIELKGMLDKQSMVFDFSKVKKRIKQVIDQTVDHKLLVPNLNKTCNITKHNKNKVDLEFTSTLNSSIRHSSPLSALCIIDTEQVNIDSVSKYLRTELLKVMPDNVETLSITLREEQGSGGENTQFYTYSHGLKKHDGNCQRIAHGHRSRIHIWLNNERAHELEQQIACDWRDIYIGSEDDITSNTNDSVSFAYQSEQGQFAITLPKDRVSIISCDSTIECLAEHLVNQLAEKLYTQADPSNNNIRIKVQAFEGVKKGAIAERS